MESSITTLESKIENLTPTLKKIANRYANGKVEADDLFQHMVEKIFRSCKAEDTKSYICQLATWTARNMVNAEKIYLRYVTTGPEQDDSETKATDFIEMFSDAEAVSPEQRLVELESEAEMRLVLAKIYPSLDDTNKQIVVMLSENKTHQTIAEFLGITRQAVTNRVRDLRGIFQLAGLTPAFMSA
jgi:RNA polymerase sigma factor (sigma-70 family)